MIEPYGIGAEPDLLTTEQVAVWCTVSPATLKLWRMNGRGPAFVKLGRLVRYRRADVEQWIEGLDKRRITRH